MVFFTSSDAVPAIDHQVIVWLNNWYRKRFGSDPVTNDMSLNVSVLAVLHIPEIRVFKGHLSFPELLNNATSLGRQLLAALPRLRDGIKAVTAEPVQPEWIRVPLDVQRKGMHSLQWLPYQLTEETVGSSLDLLTIMQSLESLQRHSKRAVPLLVDMNIHYRLMKLMYGQSTEKFDYDQSLLMTPVLYGV